jgi:hypothetical protein
VAHAVATFIAPEKLVRLPEKHVIIAEEVIIFPRAVQNPGEVVIQARVEAAPARVRGRNLVPVVAERADSHLDHARKEKSVESLSDRSGILVDGGGHLPFLSAS